MSIYNQKKKRNVLVQRLAVGNGITLMDMEIDAPLSPMEPRRIAAYTLHF